MHQPNSLALHWRKPHHQRPEFDPGVEDCGAAHCTYCRPRRLPAQTYVYYFASPYSSKDVLTREERYLKAVLAAAELGNQGYCLIEPIGMSHHSAKVCELPTGYEYWKRRDRAFIDHSDGVIVLCIPGWWESVGVTDEIHYAFETGRRVWLYETNFKGNTVFMEIDKDSYIQLQAARTAENKPS